MNLIRSIDDLLADATVKLEMYRISVSTLPRYCNKYYFYKVRRKLFKMLILFRMHVFLYN